MTEEIKTDDTPKEDLPNEEPQEETVALSVEAYNALLDKLDELEARGSKPSQLPTDIDSLVEKGTSRKTLDKEITAIDIDEMSPRQLVNFITKHVRETEVQPVIVKLEELRLTQEIKELTRDNKNQDFFNLKNEIYEIGIRNPQLSLEEALILARQRKPANTKVDDKSQNKNDLLRGLPPRRVPLGEKPGLQRVTTSDTEPSSMKEAATRAYDDIMKKK